MSTKSKKKLQVKMPEFNKKNAKLFADLIYSDKGGAVSFIKLCEGVLANGKDGGRTTHCAIGEAYHMFVSPNVSVVETRTTEEYVSKYHANAEGPTGRAIDSLVDAAQLKNKQGKAALAQALFSCVKSNDESYCNVDSNVALYMQRAQDVVETWNAEVVPLLK